MIKTRPDGYEKDLSDFMPCFFDSYCGEPVAWGFKLLTKLAEERFNALREFGELECDNSGFSPTWFLVVKKLTRDDAIEKYGQITNEEFGPRGGWKSTTFGTTKFIYRSVAPVRK